MTEKPMRCPTPVCTGWLSFVEDEDGDFWGCGECGEVWHNRKDLNAAIKDIIETYKYRKACYEKSGKDWVAASPRKEPDDYEDLVESEEYPEDDGEEEFEFRLFCCPSWGCFGMIAWCEDGPSPEIEKPGWYCDFCDDTWSTHDKLIKAIEKIIKRGPHREQLYQKTDDGWSPLGEPDDWERVVTENEKPLKEASELF